MDANTLTPQFFRMQPEDQEQNPLLSPRLFVLNIPPAPEQPVNILQQIPQQQPPPEPELGQEFLPAQYGEPFEQAVPAEPREPVNIFQQPVLAIPSNSQYGNLFAGNYPQMIDPGAGPQYLQDTNPQRPNRDVSRDVPSQGTQQKPTERKALNLGDEFEVKPQQEDAPSTFYSIKISPQGQRYLETRFGDDEVYPIYDQAEMESIVNEYPELKELYSKTIDPAKVEPNVPFTLPGDTSGKQYSVDEYGNISTSRTIQLPSGQKKTLSGGQIPLESIPENVKPILPRIYSERFKSFIGSNYPSGREDDRYFSSFPDYQPTYEKILSDYRTKAIESMKQPDPNEVMFREGLTNEAARAIETLNNSGVDPNIVSQVQSAMSSSDPASSVRSAIGMIRPNGAPKKWAPTPEAKKIDALLKPFYDAADTYNKFMAGESVQVASGAHGATGGSSIYVRRNPDPYTDEQRLQMYFASSGNAPGSLEAQAQAEALEAMREQLRQGRINLGTGAATTSIKSMGPRTWTTTRYGRDFIEHMNKAAESRAKNYYQYDQEDLKEIPQLDPMWVSKQLKDFLDKGEYDKASQFAKDALKVWYDEDLLEDEDPERLRTLIGQTLFMPIVESSSDTGDVMSIAYGLSAARPVERKMEQQEIATATTPQGSAKPPQINTSNVYIIKDRSGQNLAWVDPSKFTEHMKSLLPKAMEDSLNAAVSSGASDAEIARIKQDVRSRVGSTIRDLVRDNAAYALLDPSGNVVTSIESYRAPGVVTVKDGTVINDSFDTEASGQTIRDSANTSVKRLLQANYKDSFGQIYRIVEDYANSSMPNNTDAEKRSLNGFLSKFGTPTTSGSWTFNPNSVTSANDIYIPNEIWRETEPVGRIWEVLQKPVQDWTQKLKSAGQRFRDTDDRSDIAQTSGGKVKFVNGEQTAMEMFTRNVSLNVLLNLTGLDK